MHQDMNIVESSFEKDDKNENLIKLIIISVIIVGFGLFYFSTSAHQNAEKIDSTSSSAKTLDNKKDVTPENPSINNKNTSTANTSKPSPAKAPVAKSSSFIRPTSKSEILKLAAQCKTKKDPFEDTLGKSELTSANLNTKSNQNVNAPLPFPPSAPNLSVPKLPDLASAQPTGSLTPPPEPKEPFSLKGFLGKKVIVQVDGFTEALRVGDSYRGIKVLSIDSDNLIAKFSKDGTIITKSLNFDKDSGLSVVRRFEKTALREIK